MRARIRTYTLYITFPEPVDLSQVVDFFRNTNLQQLERTGENSWKVRITTYSTGKGSINSIRRKLVGSFGSFPQSNLTVSKIDPPDPWPNE